MPDQLLLGLIGGNIKASRSPLLHRLAGRQAEIDVRYDSLIPQEMGLDFDAVFAQCQSTGYRGVNVTYPYKEKVVAKVTISDPLVRAIGAVNTVIFGADGPVGHNTDYSGFIEAYRSVMGDKAPGTTLMIGAGGVGRAIAFALASLGATTLRLLDRDQEKAQALANDLHRAAPNMAVEVHISLPKAAAGAAGLVNCTPVGMTGHDGTPLPADLMSAPKWAFDAVYTPADTQFLTDAEQAGAVIVSGWELFFWQGVHAWGHFAGAPLNNHALRCALKNPKDAAV